MRHALQPHPILALFLTTSSVVALCCGSSSCSKPLVRISTLGGNIDVSIPSPLAQQPAVAEKFAPRGAPSAAGPAVAAPAAAVTSSIIGVEYPLDRWSPEEIDARLRRNQLEFDQLVGSRTELIGTHPDPVWERAAGGDAVDFFTSDELFALHRLELELTQLWGLLGAHHARAQLIKRVDELERDVERMQRDGVDARGQARGRAKLKDELRPQLERANKVMLAGSMGKPPLGTAQASSVPLAFGFFAGGGSETGLVDLRDLARSVRSLDQNFALGAVRGLIMWPSVTGNIIRLGDSHQKPEVRRRVLATQAAAAAAMYSERLASARSEQQVYFRDCMEFCKQIETLARAGDDRGVDAARQSRVQTALGRLLEPMAAEPSVGKKAERIGERGASATAKGAGSTAQGAGSSAQGAGSAARGSGFQDFKGGFAEVIDLDSLSEPLLQARLEAATKRHGECAATQPLTVDAAREMRSMLAHATLAGNLLRRIRIRESEKATLASLQQEARAEAELGISSEQQRDRIRKLEEELARKRYSMVSITCNEYARRENSAAWADAFEVGDWIRGNAEPLLGIWGFEIGSCLPGAHPSAGTRSMNALVRRLQDEAKRRYGAEPEISKWLVEESRFYEKLAKDIDALRNLRSTGETTQYRDAARRIDDALRARRNSTFAGFFDPLPGAAGPK
jgi:hypothetical protein